MVIIEILFVNKEVNNMSGSKIGGIKAAKTNKERHGEDFYARIGKKGGQNGHTGGFASNRELARIAGRKGGLKSRRGPAKKKMSWVESDND
jgi:general stress protein YciG